MLFILFLLPLLYFYTNHKHILSFKRFALPIVINLCLVENVRKQLFFSFVLSRTLSTTFPAVRMCRCPAGVA